VKVASPGTQPAAPARRSRVPGVTTQIFIGLFVGIAIGYFWPGVGVSIKPLADAFLRMIKMIIAPLLFSTLVVGIAGTGDLKAMGRIGIKAIIYFEVATTIALFWGLALVNWFQPGAGLAVPIGADTGELAALAQRQQHAWDIFLHLFPTSVIDAMARGDILQLVVFSTFFGIALAAIGEKGKPVVDVLEATAQLMFKFTGYVMRFAPVGVMAAIAATVEEAHPRELERLGDLAQNVVRTQFIAVLGNVGLAVPVACLIALAWPLLFGDAPVTAAKAASMLRDMHPFTSGSLFFAAVAGVGLFLSGLVSGYFDNQARYHRLAGRIAVAPWLAWLGRRHTARIGDYLDAHYGAILGNLFFGMYLGLVGVLGTLTGLPVDIRHVAFSSANLGTALTLLDAESIKQLLPWAVAGVIGIALVNLAVSFSLALYVAMKSRRLGSEQMFRLTALMLRRFAQRPLAFFSPPAKR